MTVVWTTIATLLLLMPGFAFIAGVNLTDKNVREIVFRSTPAEIAYVVAIALIIHTLLFPFGPWLLVDDYVKWAGSPSPDPAQIRPAHWAPILILGALYYILFTGVVGGYSGLWLGRLVAQKQWPIFIKHRWMTELLGANEGNVVYARVLTTTKYAPGKERGDAVVFVEGYIRDCYFAADGTLIYLAFTDFKTRVLEAANITFAAIPDGTDPEPAATVIKDGRLLLEGRNVVSVRYERVLAENVSTDIARGRILAALARRQLDQGGAGPG